MLALFISDAEAGNQWLGPDRNGYIERAANSWAAGRDFTSQDHANSRSVVIVNDAFARKFLNGALSSLIFSVQAGHSSPGNLAPFVARVIRNVNPNLAVTSRPLQEQIAGSLTQERLLALLSGFFGALALLLGSVGLYGVTSYGVNRRRAELGIRIALGANRQDVLALVLKRVALLVGSGVFLGAVLSWWAARYIAPSLLFGLQPRDPVTILGAALVLTAVSVFAGYVPARRAARVDPLVALRCE